MAEVVSDWTGGMHQLTDNAYFHWADESATLCHNAKLGRGVTMSVSAMVAVSGIAGFTTPYAAMGPEKEKEAVWEAVRSADFAYKPTRDRAFFCFANKETAQVAKARWFPEARKTLLQVRMTSSTAVCYADSRWLDCAKPEWVSASRNYWMGLETTDPLIEVIACGPLYFPEWESFSTI